MALIENTLFGTVDKVQVAIERLKTFEAQALKMHPDGYWVGDSGGKDSTVISHLVRESGVKATHHHSLTTIDPPEVVWYLRKHRPWVKIHRPKIPLLQYMVEKAKMAPTRRVRWCCSEYKEKIGRGVFLVTGVRWSESARRSHRKMNEVCMKDKATRYLNLIIDWSDADVWEYIKSRDLPYLKLYDEGFDRVGCVLCPMVRKVEQQRKRFPKIYEAWHRAVVKSWEARKAKGMSVFKESAEECWQWWLDRDAKAVNEDQMTLFE